MCSTNKKLISWLFETKAIRVCPEDKPFWYTSGSIGPYYINTHFLYGSEQKANELLNSIDILKKDILVCPVKVLELTRDNYRNDAIYKGLIDEMCSFIKANIDLKEVDYISGGERRDWFFSLLIAEILGKPHVTIYKDLSIVVSKGSNIEESSLLTDKKILHIADLITEASSYERAWIPAIRNNGGEIKWSVVVVDRMQGGKDLLHREGVESFAMVSIDKSLFEMVLSLGLINKEQYEMIINYIDEPKESMEKFLQEHPEFLKNSLDADDKTQERAKLCIEKKIYDM